MPRSKMYQNEPFEKMYQNLLTNRFECAIIVVSKRTKVRFKTKEKIKNETVRLCKSINKETEY